MYPELFSRRRDTDTRLEDPKLDGIIINKYEDKNDKKDPLKDPIGYIMDLFGSGKTRDDKVKD